MIFILSPNISARRKVGYIGLAAFIGAFILASIGNPIDTSEDQIFKIASVLGVGGLSLLILAISIGDTRSKYRYTGVTGALVMSSVIPVFCAVCLYLLGELVFESSTVERHLIGNAALIFAINIPLVILVSLFLIRMGTRATQENEEGKRH